MPGLLEIAPPEIARAAVEIRGGTLDLRGLSATELAAWREARFDKIAGSSRTAISACRR